MSRYNTKYHREVDGILYVRVVGDLSEANHSSMIVGRGSLN